MLESLGLVPRSSDTKFVCSKEDDGEVMFIEIIRDDDEPQNEGEVAPTEEPIVEYFDTFPTREELTYHKYLMSGPIPSIFLRNPIITGGCPHNLKIPCNIGHVRDVETSAHIDDDDAHVDVHDDDYVIDDATVALYRENAEKNLDVFDLFDNISTSEIEAAAREKPDIDINNEAFEVCNDCVFLNFSNKPNGGSDHITIRGKDGSLAMFYLALKNAVDADLKVEFLAPSMETKVYGSVVAYFGKNFEYSDSDDLYYLTLFKKKRSAFVGPGSLHLMRSALAVPANSSLIIKANLFDNTSENEILSGTCEITVGLDGKPTVGSIVSKDYSLSVLVNWKLPSEELKIPSSPICPPALASNSIVSRLTKRIKFGAHSTSSMAGHSTFSMTDPDERNRWSLQEELENVFNASVVWAPFCGSGDVWGVLGAAPLGVGPSSRSWNWCYNDMMESCVVCGPGFVKFKLSRKWIAEGIHRILTAGIDTWAPKLTVKKTVIYCLSQNGGEEMHMGHLRSTIIGETLARVLHHCGVVVILKRIIDKDLPNLNYLDIKLKMMMEFLIERKGQAIGELEVLYNESKKMFDEDAGFRDRANVSQDKSSYTTTMRDTIELMMVTEGDKAVTKGPNSPLVDLRALRHALIEEKAARRAKLILEDPSKCPLSHVGFGLVQGDDFKHPKAVDFVYMLDKAKSHCKGLLARTGMPDAWTTIEIEHAAEALGIDALKYADLKNNRLTNYTFSFDQMLNEEEVANGLGVVVVRPVNTRHRWDETCLLDIIVIKSTDVVGMALPVQNINHSAFRSMFEKEKLSGNNFNDWFARLKLVLRVEKKMHVIEQPLPPAPEAGAEPNIVAQWTALYDAHTEIACLMLGSMTPELHRQFELHYPYDMIQELRSMFEKQAGVEKFDLIQSFHACKQEEGKSVADYVLKMKGYVEQLERLGYMLPQDISVGLILNGLTKDFVGFVRNYNMHNMGKTIGEIHAMLIEYEKGLPKKAETPQVMMIKSGKIQKANKKSLNAKGKNKGNGKGKDKKVYIPKPNNPKSQRYIKTGFKPLSYTSKP
ncbi:anticodon-binding aminoacyl-tRNA synthetase, class 1a [Tanacetum coccineum]